MMVTNIVENGQPIGAFGDGEMWFHHDTSYYPEPNRATLLYSLKITSRGGQTCFSNMYKAYENIPRPLREKLEGRKVLQVHDYKRRERIDLEKVDVSALLHHEQPIFVTHPATGKKALYVSRLMSARIEGLSTRESETALDQLFEISEDPSIIYEHDWRLGDLVIWDNPPRRTTVNAQIDHRRTSNEILICNRARGTMLSPAAAGPWPTRRHSRGKGRHDSPIQELANGASTPPGKPGPR